MDATAGEVGDWEVPDDVRAQLTAVLSGRGMPPFLRTRITVARCDQGWYHPEANRGGGPVCGARLTSMVVSLGPDNEALARRWCPECERANPSARSLTKVAAALVAAARALDGGPTAMLGAVRDSVAGAEELAAVRTAPIAAACRWLAGRRTALDVAGPPGWADADAVLPAVVAAVVADEVQRSESPGGDSPDGGTGHRAGGVLDEAQRAEAVAAWRAHAVGRAGSFELLCERLCADASGVPLSRLPDVGLAACDGPGGLRAAALWAWERAARDEAERLWRRCGALGAALSSLGPDAVCVAEAPSGSLFEAVVLCSCWPRADGESWALPAVAGLWLARGRSGCGAVAVRAPDAPAVELVLRLWAYGPVGLGEALECARAAVA